MALLSFEDAIMEQHLIDSLKRHQEILDAMSPEEFLASWDEANHTKEKQQALLLAPKISQIIIDINRPIDPEGLHYFPERFDDFEGKCTLEELKLFLDHLDVVGNKDLVFKETEWEDCDFPNGQYHTIHGVVFDLMWGQGCSLNVYPSPSFDPYYENIGKIVQKKRKPFKSGNKINTVKGLIFHPQLNLPAYVFEEDDSYVRCDICSIVT